MNLSQAQARVACPSCTLVQPSSHAVCANCGAKLAEALSGDLAPADLLLSEDDDPTEHAAAVFSRGLELAEDRGDGLVWKALCKTGELALSPGPGQTDMEKPLQLTAELFDELKTSVDEQAFPYVTVPVSHANGLLENSGYVRQVEIVDSPDPADPPGTKLLMGGIEFTEPDIEGKVKRGSIPDTSIGVKFNYRNKRTGKRYGAALEHVALTHQPWVDGLPAFGALSQEQPSDAEYDGVYMSVEDAREDILLDNNEDDRIPPKMKPTGKQHTRRPVAEDQPKTVEQLLASQQVQIEQLQAGLNEANERADRAEGRTDSQASAIHLSNVAAKVQEWEGKHLPPSTIKVAKDILLAAGPQPATVTEDNATLTLSITVEPENEGDAAQVKEQHLSVAGIVDMLLSTVPAFGPGADVQAVVAAMSAEQSLATPKSESAKEKADSIYDRAKAAGAGTGA